MSLISDGCDQGVGWVAFVGQTVEQIGLGSPPVGLSGDRYNGGGGYLCPGFIDLHCHGGGGGSFGSTHEFDRALEVHRAHGTTKSILSLVSAPIRELEVQLDAIAHRAAEDPGVLGSHLEGPFLDIAHKGAHGEEVIRIADGASINRLIDAGRGTLRQVTIATERPHGIEALRQFVRSGVAVALGHTGATYEQAFEAFSAGATILTHTFNAMGALNHRSPGPVLAALRSPDVTLEVINDGVHVHPDMVRMLFDLAPNRVALISDAMAGAGAPDGEFELGGLSVIVLDGVARLKVGGAIAGSTLTLDVALRNAVTLVGMRLPEAVAALTHTPARAIGRGHNLGRLATGYAADAVLLSQDLRVKAVWAEGERIVG